MAFESRARGLRVLCALAAAVAVCQPAGRSWADQAEKLQQEGIARFNTGKYRQSITILQRAAGVTREPKLLGSIHLHIGLSYFVLGQQRRAREAFATAVTHDPELTLDPSRFKMPMVELFNQVRSTMRGEIAVTSKPPGALVFIDGRQVGITPVRSIQPLGAHRVEVLSPDRRQGWSGRVVVAYNEVSNLVATLRPLTGQLDLRTAPAGATVLLGDGRELGRTPLAGVTLPVGDHRLRLRLKGHRDRVIKVGIVRGVPAHVSERLEPMSGPTSAAEPGLEELARERSRKGILAWTSLGAAVGLAATAGALYGVGFTRGADAHQRYREALSQVEMDSHYEDVEQAKTMILVAHVMTGLSVAALALSVYSFASRPSAEETRGAARWPRLGLLGGPGGASLNLTWRY
jgi:hypothetical protein